VKVFLASEKRFSPNMTFLFAVLVFCLAQEFGVCVPVQERGMKFLMDLCKR
jgi:hypothetical protein